VKTPIVIDCDPGIDDIAALLLAKHMEQIDVKAVTTVAGNVELSRTTENALRVLSFIGWDVPVAKGAARPLTVELETAADVHGQDGMCGVVLPETDKTTEQIPAWDMIYELAKENPGTLEIVAVGPLTNIAVALAKYPQLTDMIRRIVIMGGAILAGNTTSSAEFNIYVDPEAAKRVFTSGIPFYMCPLDVTHQGYITASELDEIALMGSKEAKFFAEILARGLNTMKIYTGGRGVPLHDPLALMFAADDSYFTYEECFIDVETRGSFTRGKTVTDCYSDKQLDSNGFLVQTVNRDTFIGIIRKLMSCYQPE